MYLHLVKKQWNVQFGKLGRCLPACTCDRNRYGFEYGARIGCSERQVHRPLVITAGQQQKHTNALRLDLHTKYCLGPTWLLEEIFFIWIRSNWNGLPWQELKLFLGGKSFEWCNVFFYLLFFFLPPPTFICFPILMFGDLFSHHAGVSLIIALLFSFPEFHPAPSTSHYVSHPRFCCYVLFHFSPVMDLSVLLANARLEHVRSMRILLWCEHVFIWWPHLQVFLPVLLLFFLFYLK